MSKELKEHKTSNLEFGGMSPPSRVGKKSWLSEVPANWEIVLVKHLFRFNALSGIPRHDRILSLTQRGIVERDVTGNEGQLAESYDKYPEIEVGDFALNPMDLVAGWVARTDIPGKISGAYYSFHLVDEDRANPDFYEYLFQSYYREKIFDPFGSGLGRMESGGGRWTLGRYVFMNFPVPLPPVEEQQNLVAYLDQETSKMDLLIAKKEQLIEKLLERRQALITQVVTKGLDAGAQMKDSGIEWIGEVPSDWRNAPLWALSSARAGGTPKSSEPSYWDDDGLPWISIGDMSSVKKVQATSKAVSETGLNSKNIPVGRQGDVLFAMYASVGAVAMLDIKACWNQAILGLRAKPHQIKNWYLYYLLKGLGDTWELLSNANTQANLNQHSTMHLRVSVPSINQQEEMAHYLDQETSKIDELRVKAESAIALLKERRQALITKVVTGKLDVRGLTDGDS